MDGYSMPRYFQGMPQIGKPLVSYDEENERELREVEDEIAQLVYEAQSNGRSDESLNAAGQLTALQRIGELIDEGSWCPLNSLFNPGDNKTGSTSIVKGLGQINGRWAVIVASDNKKLAGAWVPGQSENLIRASDTAKKLHIPLIYLIHSAGVKFEEQENV